MANEQSFLGKGWAFPPAFNKELGTVDMVSDLEDIRQSLRIYLSTRRGERLMRLDYGSFIQQHVHDSARPANLQFLADQLRMDIRRFEPRIIVHEVEVDDSAIRDGLVRFAIYFEVQANNVRDNIVFPYYILEGTHI
jgi:hypothetical protein